MERYAIRLILLTFVLLLLAAQGTRLLAAGDSHEGDRTAILKDLEAQRASWNAGDIDAFLDAYWHSPDLTFAGSNGITRGWDGVKARYKKNYADRDAMGHLEFTDLEFRFPGQDAALVLGHWHLTRAKGDIGGVFSLVWQRFPEGWRIIHDHTSAVEPAK